MASISGPTGSHPALTLKGQPMAPAPEGELAGKSVTAGGALKTVGRVALGIVTLGISELVIRLAQRGSPDVVPTAEPGRAAVALNLADAPPPDQERELKRVLGDATYDSFLARARQRAEAEGGWQGWQGKLKAHAEEQALEDDLAYNQDRSSKPVPAVPRHPFVEAAAKLTEPELVAYYASTSKTAQEQLRAGGNMQEKEPVIDSIVAGAVKKLTPPMEKEQIARYHEEDMLKAIGKDRYDEYRSLAADRINGAILSKNVERDEAYKLSKPMAAAVNLYTDGDPGRRYYLQINAEITRNKPEERDDMTPEERQTAVGTRDAMLLIAGVLDHALEQLAPAKPRPDQDGLVPEYLIVHRGANLTEQDLAKYVPGAEVTEPRYTSTSASSEKAFKGNTQFAIIGKTGRDISFCSKYPEEQEVLFPNDTTFQVLHREQLEDNTTRIVMKEIDKEPQ